MVRYSQNNRRERGDTIVEVLLAIAVISAVLASAFAITNRNMKQNLANQERTQAVRVAEQQLELFKAAVGSPGFLASTTGTFCMKAGTSGPEIERVTCGLSGSGDATTAEPIFSVAMQTFTPTYAVAPGSKPQGKKVRIHVEWESAHGDRRDSLDSWAEVYENDY